MISGFPYRVLLRTGKTTQLVATEGKIATYNGNTRIGECVSFMAVSTTVSKNSWVEADKIFQSCDGSDVMLKVSIVE